MAITVPVCATEKYTSRLLLSIVLISVGITTFPLPSKTVMAGYLSPRLCKNDHVVNGELTVNLALAPATDPASPYDNTPLPVL